MCPARPLLWMRPKRSCSGIALCFGCLMLLLHQGHLAAAAHLAQTHDLPISQARVHLAQGDTSAALAVLEQLRQQAEAKGWAGERLKGMVLPAVGLQAHGAKGKAGERPFEGAAPTVPARC